MIRTIVRKNEYYDSVFLMKLAGEVQEIKGVQQVVIIMGTDLNKTILQDVGLLTPEAQNASPNDLIVALEAEEDEKVIDRALQALEDLKHQKRVSASHEIGYPTLDIAIDATPEANLAFIAVPGENAGAEARKALHKGLHVFIFSDNVSLQEEIELKRLAQEKDLLVMGPGCGASVINRVSLGLMSTIRSGPIGMVGASGSGIQEAAVLIDHYGLGVSQAIGTGGRDLSDEVGGITMLQGLKALEEDEATSVIVLISKPPAKKTMESVLKAVSSCSKPVVVNFLGGDQETIEKAGGISAFTIEETALKAVALAKKETWTDDYLEMVEKELAPLAEAEKRGFTSGQKYLRGLFFGGTHCEEAVLILKDHIGPIYGNVPVPPCIPLKNVQVSRQHSVIDLGAEEFTRGRPHPVIDLRYAKERLWKEGCDPEVRVILIDLILGFGAHPDPAGALKETFEAIKEKARREDRHLCLVISVCGSDRDPQNRSLQVEKFKKMGLLVMPSNARASILAKMLVSGQGD